LFDWGLVSALRFLPVFVGFGFVQKSITCGRMIPNPRNAPDLPGHGPGFGRPFRALNFCGDVWFLGRCPRLRLLLSRWGVKTQNLKPQNPANTGEEPKEFRSPVGRPGGSPRVTPHFAARCLPACFQIKVAPEFESRIFTFGAGRLAPRKTISRPYPNRLVLLSFPSFAT
jgi:hypothetical protein